MPKYEYLSYIIPADRTKPVKEVITQGKPEYEFLRETVGGLIQPIPYFTKYNGRSRGTAYANEEGWLLGLPLNTRASDAWLACFPEGSTGLAGDVIISFRQPRQPQTETNS